MEKCEERHYSEKEVIVNREEQLQKILPDILTAWDPMGYTFNSPLNRFELDPEDVTQGHRCIFYDGFSDTCCMGDYCRALHVKDKEAGKKQIGPLTSEKKIQNLWIRKDNKMQERVSCANNLDPRGVAAPASLFKGVVSCAEAPSNFFLVPELNLNCACSGICSHDDHRQKYNPEENPSTKPGIGSEKKYSGIECYNKIVKEMSKDMGKKSEANYSRHCYEFELVAFDVGSISLKKPHRPLWLRGVLANPVYEEDYNNGKLPTAEIFLFDTGHMVTTNPRQIRQLPLLYSKIPPFAIRCELYGIRPKRMSPKKNQGNSEPQQWSADAIKDFRKLVKSSGNIMSTHELETTNLVIVEVKKSTCTDSDGVFQPTPYSVMITVPADDKNGKGVNVSEEMVQLGHAEFTNFNSECGYSFSEWEFLHPLSSL